MASKREIDVARGERIKLVRTKVMHMKSQEKFAEAISALGKVITRGAVGNWELGKEVSLDSLTAICELSGVDLNWLAYNKGEAPVIETIAETGIKRPLISSFDDADVPPEEIDPDWDGEGAGYVDGQIIFDAKLEGGRPEFSNKPGLGEGQTDDRMARVNSNGIASGHPVVNEWVIPPSYVRNALDASPTQIIILPVVGNSMLPILASNDRIMVDVSQNAYAGEAVYVIDDGDGVFQAKTLRKVMSSFPPVFEIVSEANVAAQPIKRRHDEFRIVGRVVGRFTRM
jgi:hypothetical protein